jgi:hypothetical protein
VLGLSAIADFHTTRFGGIQGVIPEDGARCGPMVAQRLLAGIKPGPHDFRK